jgi:GT2 family glycosyltransferase
MRHIRRPQGGGLELDGALLAPLDAVAVVHDEYAHSAGYAIQPMEATVVVPTSGRAGYLEVTLDSLCRQRASTPADVLVVDDGSTDATPEVAARFGVRVLASRRRRGLNAARNAGLREARGDLIAFVDDDVFVPPGWLDALIEGARRYPDAEAFGGPIRARLEGHPPRSCGREDPPITTLDLGPVDVDAEMVWGANFAVRRSAVQRIGEFDESLDRGHGDEEDWLLRLRAAGGQIMYLADAGLDHRRSPGDSGLGSLARAAYHRGRGARSSDLRRGKAPGVPLELRQLAGCGWHTVRRACPQGVIMGAHAAGRVVEALRPR